MLSIGANISRKIININKNEISKEEFVALVEEHKLSLYRFAKSILKNDIEVKDAISVGVYMKIIEIAKITKLNLNVKYADILKMLI